MWKLTLGYNILEVCFSTSKGNTRKQTAEQKYEEKIMQGAEACAMSSGGAFAFSNRPPGTELEKLHYVTCPPITLKRLELRLEPSQWAIQCRRRARVQALR
jgi:hypothetical protein